MTNLIDSRKLNADYSEVGAGVEPRKFSLLTLKRLLRSRHKIFLGVCALLFVAAGVMFIACKKEIVNTQKEDITSVNQQKDILVYGWYGWLNGVYVYLANYGWIDGFEIHITVYESADGKGRRQPPVDPYYPINEYKCSRCFADLEYNPNFTPSFICPICHCPNNKDPDCNCSVCHN